jgi:hypothetical protein
LGSNLYPWGPHGPRMDYPGSVPPHPGSSPTPPPSYDTPFVSSLPPPTSYPSSGGTDYYPSGGTNTGRVAGGGGHFVGSLVLVWFLWPFWVCLYPLAAAAGLGAAVAGATAGARFLPPMDRATFTALAALIGYVSGIVVLVMASRWDHGLSQYAAYRIPRHVLRMALLGGLAFVALADPSRIPFYGSHIPPELTLLTTPAKIGVAAAFAAGMHFLLWNWHGARQFWHRRLQAVGLRKRQS